MHKVYLGIGGNIGNKKSNFKRAFKLIENNLGKIKKKSSLYESSPWGFYAEEYFWNQVLLIETLLQPEELLYEIHKIQNQFTRETNSEKYASREMDIDILYFDNITMESDDLIIPHTQIQNRLFVLAPLSEIAPSLKHPILGLSSLELLDICKDDSIVQKIDAN